ncbi:hypothetical protein [Saccharothrix syringae]|nr:hypothetical protein [Saccharothrix syringae]
MAEKDEVVRDATADGTGRAERLKALSRDGRERYAALLDRLSR